MSTSQITRAALDLSLPERIALAQQLWESAFADEGIIAKQSDEPIEEVIQRRAAQLDAGEVTTIPHVRAMAAARRALG